MNLILRGKYEPVLSTLIVTEYNLSYCILNCTLMVIMAVTTCSSHETTLVMSIYFVFNFKCINHDSQLFLGHFERYLSVSRTICFVRISFFNFMLSFNER